jgi:SAM-dependent methyltransferase
MPSAAGPRHDPAWPEVWSALYDAMDVNRQPHLDFYCSLVTPGTERLLDLGCGTGSITLAIAAAMTQVARVTGVDLSPEMIRIAQHRAPQHVWKVGNLCAPPVTGPFDLITVCFHTLQVLTDPDDLGRCLAAVAGLLAPAGRFAFDIYRPNTAWLAAVSPGPHLARQFRDGRGRLIDVIESEAHYDATARVLSGLWNLRDNATGEDLGVEPLEQRVRQYFPDDIATALARAGLRATEAWGDLDRSAFAPGSKRQVYVCRRA